jgi:hypothetical protein
MVAVLTVFVLVSLKWAMTFFPDRNNMKPLYDICQRISGGNAKEVIVFKKSQLYGLQFYMNGRLQRVSPTGKESWADGCIEDTIRKMQRSASLSSHVFITDKQQAPMLCNLFRKSGIQFQRFDNGYWVACLVVNRPSILCPQLSAVK